MNIPHWWQNGVIYQVYPKSFQDTTGSGTGDLRGVTQRLDYLQKLGVDAIWLTPFYISPQVDNGYDVADYLSVDPAYGTLEDFDELVAQAKARGIRIILDMVFNHTSTQHAWFREALDKDSPYRQFYLWRDGTPDSPPNNWRSKFGGNAWGWHAESEQYYLHLFAPEQADLNWENPAVRAELKKSASSGPIAAWTDCASTW
jgi:trehalose-6-phosphate hydrolase